MGVLSPRFQNATVTRSAGKTVQVLDAAKAVASLKAKGLDTYVSETVNQLFFDSATKEIAKAGKTDIDERYPLEPYFLRARRTSIPPANRVNAPTPT